MDLTNINLADFRSPVKSNNTSLAMGGKLSRLMTQLGMPTFTLYAIAGGVTASDQDLVTAGVDVQKDQLYLFLSLDPFDADNDSPEYAAPTNDLCVGKLVEITKGKHGLDLALTLADHYNQALKLRSGSRMLDPLQTIINSPLINASVNHEINTLIRSA